MEKCQVMPEMSNGELKWHDWHNAALLQRVICQYICYIRVK